MLDLSPILLVSTAVIFLLVLARLNSCLYKPLLKHMDQRDSKIKEDMENARNNGADVDGMLEEAKHIIAEAKKEAASIREKARVEAMEIAEAKLSDAKSKMESKYTDFVKSLDEERSALESSLVSQIPVFKDSLKSKLSTM